jgi:hypothetical protein
VLPQVCSGTNCDKTTLGRGSLPGSTFRWSENTINTHKYNTIYWSSNRSYYNLGLCISYIEEVWRQNYASGDKLDFAEAISLNGQNILFALKDNAIHWHSKPEEPSTESIPIGLDFPLTTIIGIAGRREQHLTYTQKTIRAKLERLRSAKLIQGGQKITSRHTEVLTRLKDS